MNLLALDLSLRATGWATRVASGIFGAEDLSGLDRIASLRDDVLRLARHAEADLVLLEGLVVGLKGGTVLELAGLGYVVRLALVEASFPIVDVPPSTLKKFATGSGLAKKDQMLAEAIRRLGYAGHDHNEADALWLLQAGLHHFRIQPSTLPKPQLAALAKVPWPDLAVR